MAALQRQDATVVPQPTGGFAVANYGMDKMMEAQQWGAVGSVAQTGFDVVKRQYDQDAIDQARIDAPQIVQRDGSSALIPVSTFEAPGIHSRAYREAYKTLAFNTYSTNVEQDHQNFIQTTAAKYPTDPQAASAALEERKNAVVQGLDPQYAPLITLRLNGMNGQAVSRINANLQQETNRVADTQAKWNYQNVVERAAQLGATPDLFPGGVLNVNHKILGADIQKTDQLMTSAGWSPAQKAEYWSKAKVNVEIARDSQMLRSWVMSKDQLAPGQYEQGLIDARNMIVDKTKKMGADGQAYFAATSAALGWAMGTNQLQIQRNDQIAGVADAKKRLEIEQLNRPEVRGRMELDQGDILRKIELDRNAVFTDPTLTDAQKLRRIGSMDAAGNAVRTDLANYTNSKATQLATQALDVNTPPERSKGMVRELSQISSDPINGTWLPVGTRNFIDRTVSQIASNEAKSDFATFSGYALGGKLEPIHVQERLKAMSDKGLISDAPNALMRPDAAAQFMAQSEAAYRQRQFTGGIARQVVQGAAKGDAPNDFQKQAIKDIPELSFRTGDGAPYDPVNEGHRQDAAASFNQTMTMPEEVKSSMKSVKMLGDPQRAMAIADQAQQFKSVLMQKPGMTEERAIGRLREDLGGGIYDYLALATRFDPETAGKMMANKATSDGRNLGASSTVAADSIGAIWDNTLTKLTQPGASVIDRLNPFQPLSQEQQWQRYMLGDKAQTLGGRILQDIKPFGTDRAGPYASISSTDDIKREITAAAYGIMKDGGDLTDKAHPQTTKEQVALMQAMERYRDKTEIVADPADVTKGILQWKSAATQLGDIMKVGGVSPKLSDREVHGFATGLYEEELRNRREAGLPDLAVPGIDRNSITMVPRMSSDGSLSWDVRGQYASGVGTATLMTLAQSDPRIGAFAGDMINQSIRDLREHWHGITVRPPPADEMHWAGRIVGHLANGIDGTGRALFADYKQRQYLGQRLESFGNRPQGDLYTQAVDAVFGREPSHELRFPTRSGDLELTKKAFSESKNTEMQDRARNMQMMNTLNARTRQLPPAR